MRKTGANITGLISKSVDAEELLRCVLALLKSRQAFCHITQDRVLAELTPSGLLGKRGAGLQRIGSRTMLLSRREKQVMGFVKAGKRTGEIANLLNLKQSTVSTMKAKALKS
jgi:DNA-binding NarL/FixJ family response regulator